MRVLALVSPLLAVVLLPSPALRAQAAPAKTQTSIGFLSRSEVAIAFNAVRTETNFTRASQSSWFTLAGASATAAYRVRPHVSAVAEFSGTHVNGVQDTGLSLTELMYLFGGRYGLRPAGHFAPFAQVLVGGVHATGGIFPPNAFTSGGADSFAMTAGGGLDYPVSPAISLRAAAYYVMTALPNGDNNRQNHFRGDAGFVVHFGKR